MGHALGGLAAGWLVRGVAAARAPGSSGTGWRRLLADGTFRTQAVLFAVLGMLPDIDFLFGMHSMQTHSLGAAIAVGIAGFALLRHDRALTALGCACAYASHVLLDWLGDDTTPPIGIMALWPITGDFYQSDLHWFMAISRRYWLPNFWTHNLQAVMWEVLLLAPAAALAFWLRRGRARRTGRSGTAPIGARRSRGRHA